MVTRLDRRFSTVYKIVVKTDSGSEVICYAKRFKQPLRDPDQAKRLRLRVERSSMVSERISEAGRPLGVGVAEVLAADTEQLTVVTLGVGGDPLGRAWTHAITPARRARSEGLFGQIGQAIREIESASVGEAPPTGYLERPKIEHAIAAAIPYLPETDRRRTTALVRSLHDEYSANDGGTFFCHGDINHSNVLVDGGVINLIDFDLSSRPLTYDLSLYLMRLEMERQPTQSWTRQVKDWVIAGYGTTDIVQTPAYSLVQVVRLARGIERSAALGNTRKMRRFAETLRSTLAAV